MTSKFKDHKRKYLLHRQRAKQRDIKWLFNYITWRRIWSESGKWNQRGHCKGQYVMSRPGDKGPYAPWNVRIISSGANISEAQLGCERSEETKAKVSASLIGNIRSRGNKTWLGKKLSLEHKAKLSAAAKARCVNPKERARMKEIRKLVGKRTSPGGAA